MSYTPFQSNHGKFQNRNKTKQESDKYKKPKRKESHLPILAKKPHISLKYSNTQLQNSILH